MLWLRASKDLAVVALLAVVFTVSEGCAGGGFGSSVVSTSNSASVTPSTVVGQNAKTVETRPVRIGYPAQAFESGAICLSDSDGQTVTTLNCDCCPRKAGRVTWLSLAAGRVAVTCALERTQESPATTSLHVIDLATREETIIANDSVSQSFASFSPSGRFLAYYVQVDRGPAPVAASELWVYDFAAGSASRVDRPRYFVGDVLWSSDEKRLYYSVGQWEKTNSSGPVTTYAVDLESGEARPWLEDLELVAAGPDDRWLAKRVAKVGYAFESQSFLVDAGGSAVRIPGDGAASTYPLGWLDGDPVFWVASSQDPSRGSAYVLRGSSLHKVVDNLLRPNAQTEREAVVVDGRLFHMLDGRLVWGGSGPVWSENLRTGDRIQLPVPGRRPLSGW